MSTLAKGWIVALAHVLLAGSVGAKFLYDRASLPRLWVETAPYDPDMPIRGRYVSLALRVDAERPPLLDERRGAPAMFRARLENRDGRLAAIDDSERGRHWVRVGRCGTAPCWLLSEPVAYFIPEHAEDPSRRPADEVLWVEVTLPPKGAPRPVRLGVMKDGELRPLEE